MVANFSPAVIFGESKFALKLFPWPITFGNSRPQLLVGLNVKAQVVFLMDIDPYVPAFSGFGIDQNPNTFEYVVEETVSMVMYDANGTVVQSLDACDLHHEAYFNRQTTSDGHPPYSQVLTLGKVGHYLYENYTQVDDILTIWNLEDNSYIIKGDLHTDFHVPYELRDDLSDTFDIYAYDCIRSSNATVGLQDWSHGNSLKYGSQYVIFNARHMQSTILLFDLNMTRVEYYVGGALSDFTFATEDAKWYAAHDVHESYYDGHIMRLIMYDNGNGRPAAIEFSRGLEIELNFNTMVIELVEEYNLNWNASDPTSRCFTNFTGGIERRGRTTLVTFPFCWGEQSTVLGKYGHMVEYNSNSGVITGHTIVDNADPQPLPANGLYRTLVVDSLGGEFEV